MKWLVFMILPLFFIQEGAPGEKIEKLLPQEQGEGKKKGIGTGVNNGMRPTTIKPPPATTETPNLSELAGTVCYI